MSGWTTSDMLAELDRRGFEVNGWSPTLSPIAVIQLLFYTLALSYAVAMATAAASKSPEVRARYVEVARLAIAKVEELAHLWKTLWPDVRG